MPPRRCLPSWLGRQLHANGGGGVTGAGPMVAPRVLLARALPRPRQGSFRGPDKGLAVAPVVIPGKALAGGLVVFLGWDPAKDHHLLKCASDLECLHKDLHTTTGMPPESLPHGGSGLKGDPLRRRGASFPGKGLAGLAKTTSRQGSCQGGAPASSPLLFVVLASSCSSLTLASPRSYLPCRAWCSGARGSDCPCTVIVVQNVYPPFLYTDRSPRAWATHEHYTLLGQAQERCAGRQG